MIETYELPQGKIMIVYCNENVSIGLLELNSNQEIPKHLRPISEELSQIYGVSVIKILDGDTIIREDIINEGQGLKVPANQVHIHSNPTNDKSIALWKFDGNIIEVIEGIRKNFRRI